MKDNKRKTVGSKNSFRRGQDYKPVVGSRDKKSWRSWRRGGEFLGKMQENTVIVERLLKQKESPEEPYYVDISLDFSRTRGAEAGSVSTLAGAKREYRCAVSSLPGNGQSLFIRPAATRIGSGYNCRIPGKESSLVETVYIYIYILLLFPNKSTRERKHTGWREERGLRYFQERFLERKTEEITAKHEKEDTKRERERRGIIIKMREISKRSWIYVGTKMVSPGIKGSPYIRIVVTEVSTCRRIFICISISARPPLRPWESQVQFYLSASIVRSHRPNTFGYLYFITRVFLYQTRSQDPLFPRREQYARFAAGNTLIFYPVVARTHRFPSRR